jgi:HAD superfamily hydrolase (TIGR01509 family)
MMASTSPTSAVLLDLDGTLVDSLYLHVVAWHEAFHAAGYAVPMVAIHAAIGMGSDRLMPHLLGEHVDDADAVSDDHKRRFLEGADSLEPTPGAAALLDDLDTRGVPYVVATSASGQERDTLLAALGREDLPIVGSDDVDSSKPAPDMLLAAQDQLERTPDHAVMVGDAPWDARAAVRAGMEAVAVRCGGFSDASLRAAGATRIVDTPRDLIGTL